MVKIDIAFLKSKVARRIFTYFIGCALIPVAALAMLSFMQVAHQLRDHDIRSLSEINKVFGMTLMDRLSVIEMELVLIGSRDLQNGAPPSDEQDTYSEHMKHLFDSVAVIDELGNCTDILGHSEIPLSLTKVQSDHLRAGKPLITVLYTNGSDIKIFMLLSLPPNHSDRRLIIGEINRAYLTRMAANRLLPVRSDFSILDDAHRVIYSSSPLSPLLYDRLITEMKDSPWGELDWNDHNTGYLAVYWPVFLKYRYETPKWTVVTGAEKADIFSILSDYKRNFLFIILMSLWIVLLLSLIHIRRSLSPLEVLKEGTRRVARRDFTGPVIVKSGDEFEELAASFNDMTSNLERQFHILTTITEIDRAILSEYDLERLIRTVIPYLPEIMRCHAVGISLIGNTEERRIDTYASGTNPPIPIHADRCSLSPVDVRMLRETHGELTVTSADPCPAYLLPFINQGYNTFSVVPVLLNSEPVAFIILANRDGLSISSDDLTVARQLGDQITVALANVRLIDELRQLNANVVKSIANAIDAKSRWTAGHSERVAQLSLHIGRAFNLSDRELETLRTGGLLHDVGMIGIPSNLIDKSDPLTAEEQLMIREHPSIGVKILAPISTRHDILTLVAQHHERYDGTGYPRGLSGDDICRGARIIAIADTYDALVSDRPYRNGLRHEDVREIIRGESGKQFDPDVVRVFLVAIESSEYESQQHMT